MDADTARYLLQVALAAAVTAWAAWRYGGASVLLCALVLAVAVDLVPHRCEAAGVRITCEPAIDGQLDRLDIDHLSRPEEAHRGNHP